MQESATSQPPAEAQSQTASEPRRAVVIIPDPPDQACPLPIVGMPLVERLQRSLLARRYAKVYLFVPTRVDAFYFFPTQANPDVVIVHSLEDIEEERCLVLPASSVFVPELCPDSFWNRTDNVKDPRGSAYFVQRGAFSGVSLGAADSTPAAPFTGWTEERLPYDEVRTRDDIARIEARLFSNLAKPTDGVMSRAVNRKISTAITRMLILFPIPPNAVTVANFFLALLVPVLLIRGDFWGLFFGSIVFNLASIVDGCDGEIARLKFMFSDFGVWFDTVCDLLGIMLFFLAFPIGMFRMTGSSGYLIGGVAMLLAIAATMVLLAYFGKRYLKSGLLNSFERLIGEQFAATPRLLQAIDTAKLLGKRDVYAWAFMIFCIVGLPELVLYSSAIGIIAYMLVIGTTVQRFYKTRRSA